MCFLHLILYNDFKMPFIFRIEYLIEIIISFCRVQFQIVLSFYDLILCDLEGADSAPLVHFHLYVFPCLLNASESVCRMPLRFSKFNFLSYSNETVTILEFYF